MDKIRIIYLLGAVVIFLVAIAMIFFAATDSKNTIGLFVVAVFFALTGFFWTYLSVRGNRTL